MKKISIGLNVLLALLVVFLLIKQQNIFKTKSTNNCNPVCVNYLDSPRFHYIDAYLLDTMATLYQADIKNGESISTWYSLADLKRFIWEIEYSLCNSNCPVQEDPLNLGIRIYFAKYPVMPGSNSYFPDLRNLNVAYQEKKTLFMVPTFDTYTYDKSHTYVETVHTDFNLASGPGNEKCVLTRISGDVTSAASGQIPVAALLPTGKNHGPLCPPDDCVGAVFSKQ